VVTLFLLLQVDESTTTTMRSVQPPPLLQLVGITFFALSESRFRPRRGVWGVGQSYFVRLAILYVACPPSSPPSFPPSPPLPPSSSTQAIMRGFIPPPEAARTRDPHVPVCVLHLPLQSKTQCAFSLLATKNAFSLLMRLVISPF